MNESDLVNRTLFLINKKMLAESKISCNLGIKNFPQNYYFYNLLSFIEIQNSNFVEAVKLLDKAIKLNPSSEELYLNRGNVYLNLNQLEKANADYDESIKINSNLAVAYSNRAIIFMKRGEFEKAIMDYNKALNLHQDYQLYLNRGNAYFRINNIILAIKDYDHSINLNPNNAESYLNRGKLYAETKQFLKATDDFNHAIKLYPNYVEAHYNLSLIELLKGSFEKGFTLYEWRLKFLHLKRIFSATRWTGKENINNKKILIYCEQGLGDTIQFVRYCKLVKQLGATVYLEAPKKLIPLLKLVDGFDQIIEKSDKLIDVNFYSSLMSLPFAFNTNLATIPSNVPYINLTSTDSRILKWKKYLGSDGFKIAICWKGSSSNKNNHNRSFTLDLFENISKIENIRLISLQKSFDSKNDENIKYNFNLEFLPDDFDEGENAFLDSAAILKSVDLLITCDTSLGHLAGALGVKTFIVISYVPDWRWMLDSDISPWYPKHKIFRQKKIGDWKSVFNQIEKEIKTNIFKKKI